MERLLELDTNQASAEDIVFGSALSGGYVIATVSCPPASMLIFNIAASSLSVKNSNIGNLYGLGIEPTSGR